MEPATMSPEINVHTATVDAIVAFCLSASCKTIGEALGTWGRKVVKVSEQEVIKFGLGVTESVANNQKGAYSLLNLSIIGFLRSIGPSPKVVMVTLLWNTSRAKFFHH